MTQINNNRYEVLPHGPEANQMARHRHDNILCRAEYRAGTLAVEADIAELVVDLAPAPPTPEFVAPVSPLTATSDDQVAAARQQLEEIWNVPEAA